jgi:hypothetical protein
MVKKTTGFAGDPDYEIGDDFVAGKMLAKAEEPQLTEKGEITASIVKRVFGMDNADDILSAGEQGAKGLRDMLGEVFAIKSLKWLKAAEKYRENSMGVFVLMEVFTGDGSVEVVSCGGANVLTQLYRLEELGCIPDPDRKLVAYSKVTGSGFDVLWLKSGHPATSGDKDR